MREGVPRYVLQTPYPEIEGRSMFAQQRNFGNNAEHLFPLDQVPLRIQDRMAYATEVDVTRSLVGLIRYCVDQPIEGGPLNIRSAFGNLRKMLQLMETFPRQSHKEIVQDVIEEMTDIALTPNRMGNIAETALAYGILTPYSFFNQIKRPTHLNAKVLRGSFRDGYEELPDQQREIVSTAGLYVEWEVLNEFGVEGFSGQNPFKPYLDVIENGHVGIFIDRAHGRNVYTTRPYTEKPVENLELLVA